RGIELYANKKGYNVIVGLSNESFDKEVINMDMLANGSIDGFILSISKETLQLQDYHHFNETINQGMPIVMFDRVVNEIDCDKVIVDDFEGAKNAVKTLLQNECSNIALITTKDYVNVGKYRTHGYLAALEAFDVLPKQEYILKVDDESLSEYNLTSLEEEIQEMFIQNPEIDGVFAVNEIYAITAMKVARKLGKKIPHDLQVIGFTDGVISRHAVPGLTTVSQHGEKIGEKAAELLINRIENENQEDQIKTLVIPTELIVRESTKQNLTVSN